MKHITLAAILATFSLSPAFSDTATEGRHLAKLTFQSVDSNENGSLDMGETHNFGVDMFASMDADENALISEAEFLDWGYGFQNIAEDTNKELAYKTALRVVFSFWDRNVDGNISRTEQRTAVNHDFRRADINGDALLSEAEFFNGFSIPVAIRTALKP